jgi:aldehyde dehydrogenase (NAD+)
MFQKAKELFEKGETKQLPWRVERLKKLKATLIEREPHLLDALKQDLGKGTAEARATEIGFVINEINHTLKHIHSWASPVEVSAPLLSWPANAAFCPQPRGVVLIIAPWNYPVNLSLSPLVGAIAAGNTVVLKPSEMAPAVATELSQIITLVFPDGEVATAEGGVEVSKKLLTQPFDHFFFTGSTHVGREVGIAAAGHLSTYTLELGGKSPCIVDHTADLKRAGKRIAWGKTVNAGQTCVAPDYVMAHADIYDDLIHEITKSWKSFFGKHPESSSDYGRIVNERHFDRITSFITNHNARVIGGHSNRATKFIEPTILADVSVDHPSMGDEIFGPVLPVLRWRNEQDIKDIVARNPNPLALYIFSKQRDFRDRIITAIPSGGVSVNHVVHHMACPDLPFGGIRASGTGKYHGKFGFDEFSHLRAVYEATSSFEPSLKYPPYGIAKKILRWLY